MTPAQVVETSVNVIAKSQGHNELCGIPRGWIRDQKMGSEITALGSGITDHGIGISSFFQGSGIRLYRICGIRGENWSRRWNQGSEICVQKWDQRSKPFLVSTMKESFTGLHSAGRLSILSLLFYLYFLLLVGRI